ncbi:MAG: helix-turn-helix domain-containing protein [Muribaculaceae bacterium]|nr:helix-turn-helix domain-containing protein [Muribaculaceae bacterium]
MQEKNVITMQLSIVLGKYLVELREKRGYYSRKKFADEYDLNDSNLSRIERGLGEVKFVTLLKILQALDISPAEFMNGLEKKLGKEFTLIDV